MANGELQFHEAANLFPLDDEHIDELAKDIKERGQVLPIQLLDGKILDGRRRYQACRLAGIKVAAEDVHPEDPIAFVLSLNLHRRHLTPSQEGMVAARAEKLYTKAAKDRQRGGPGGKMLPANLQEGTALGYAAKAVGVSERTAAYAKKVLDQGTPELAQAVDQGRMAVSTAAILATEPPEVQREAATDPKRNRRYGPGGGGQRKSNPLGESIADQEPDQEEPQPKRNGKPPVGVILANEALNVLMRIPKNDPLRKRGFQIVTDWIRTNS